MSWSYVDSGTAGTGNNSTSLSPGLPSYAEHDLLILQVQTFGGTNGRVPQTPSGWSELGSWANGTSRHLTCYKVATSSESAPTVSMTGSGAASDTQLARIHSFRSGVGIPTLDVTGATSTNASADNIGPITGITPTTGALLIISAGKSNDFNGTGSLTNYTQAAMTESTTGNDAGMTLMYRLSAPAGATGNLTVTDNGGTNSNGVGFGIHVSFVEVVDTSLNTALSAGGTLAADLSVEKPLAASLSASGAMVADLTIPTSGGASFSDDFDAYASNYLAVVNSTDWENMAGLFNGILCNGSGTVRGDGSYSATAVKASSVAFAADQRAKITVTTASGDFIGVLLRIDTSVGSGIGVYFSNSGGYRSRFTTGGQSEDYHYIDESVSNGDVIEAVVIGDDFFVYINDVLVYTGTGDASAHPSGQPGILWYGTGGAGDNFEAHDVGGSAPVDLASAVSAGITTTAALSVDKPLAAVLAAALSTSAALTVPKPLAAAVSAAGTTTAALSVPKPLATALVASLSTSPSLSVPKPLAAAVSAALTTSAALSVPKPLASALTGSGTISAALGVPKPLATALGAALTMSASLTVPKPLTVVLSVTLSMAGTLSVPKPLAAGLSGALTVTAALGVDKPLAAWLSGALTLAAELEAVQFAADLAAAITMAADLTAPIQFASALTATASVSSGLTVEKPLSVAVQASLMTTAALTVDKPLSVALSGALTVTGAAVAVAKPLNAALLATLDVLAALSVPKQLATALAGAMTTNGDITVPKPLAVDVVSSLSQSAALDVPKALAANVALALSCDAALDVPKPLAAAVSVTMVTTALLSAPVLVAYFDGSVVSRSQYRGVVRLAAQTHSALALQLQTTGALVAVSQHHASCVIDHSTRAALRMQVQTGATVHSRPQQNANLTLRAGEP